MKFLAGILLVQGATAMLVYAWLQQDQGQVWFALSALTLAVLASFWFTSIAGHLSKDQLACERNRFAREREEMRAKTERDKVRLIRQGQRQMAKERDRVQNRASLKVGAAFAAVIGIGLVMLMTQFFTLGLFAISAAGGALGGYILRTRRTQDALAEPTETATGVIPAAARRRKPSAISRRSPLARYPGSGPSGKLAE
jgi:hypothetical protein